MYITYIIKKIQMMRLICFKWYIVANLNNYIVFILECFRVHAARDINIIGQQRSHVSIYYLYNVEHNYIYYVLCI